MQGILSEAIPNVTMAITAHQQTYQTSFGTNANRVQASLLSALQAFYAEICAGNHDAAPISPEALKALKKEVCDLLNATRDPSTTPVTLTDLPDALFAGAGYFHKAWLPYKAVVAPPYYALAHLVNGIHNYDQFIAFCAQFAYLRGTAPFTTDAHFMVLPLGVVSACRLADSVHAVVTAPECERERRDYSVCNARFRSQIADAPHTLRGVYASFTYRSVAAGIHTAYSDQVAEYWTLTQEAARLERTVNALKRRRDAINTEIGKLSKHLENEERELGTARTAVSTFRAAHPLAETASQTLQKSATADKIQEIAARVLSPETLTRLGTALQAELSAASAGLVAEAAALLPVSLAAPLAVGGAGGRPHDDAVSSNVAKATVAVLPPRPAVATAAAPGDGGEDPVAITVGDSHEGARALAELAARLPVVPVTAPFLAAQLPAVPDHDPVEITAGSAAPAPMPA